MGSSFASELLLSENILPIFDRDDQVDSFLRPAQGRAPLFVQPLLLPRSRALVLQGRLDVPCPPHHPQQEGPGVSPPRPGPARCRGLGRAFPAPWAAGRRGCGARAVPPGGPRERGPSEAQSRRGRALGARAALPGAPGLRALTGHTQGRAHFMAALPGPGDIV